MKFLFPDFLLALSAVLIPVIIHLFNFRKFKKIYFSNVRFLKEIDQRTASSRKLKHLWLLATRVLAIIFLVLAFARPYIPRGESLSTYQNESVSIYIDNSYSMESINREGTLLDEARRRAKEIASAYALNDRFQLLTNDFEGQHQRFYNFNEFADEVDNVKISPVSRNLQEVLSRQQDLLDDESNSAKTVYIISDFQNNLLNNGDIIKPDPSVKLRFVKLQSNSQANISIDSVWFLSPVHKTAEPERLVIQLRNNSGERAENIPFKLNIDNKQKAIGSLSLNARATQRDTLSFSGLSAGWKNGEITITDYPVVFDNQFFFTFKVDNRMNILVINEKQENEYLKALYGSDSFFSVKNTSSGSINYSALSSYPLIILNSVENISAGLAGQLALYVRNGGSLVIFPSLQDIFGLKTLTSVLGTDQPESIVTQQQSVVSINLQHPVFKGVFEQLPKNMDLPVAKKYVQYSRQSRTSKQNILSFSWQRTFFSQYNTGKGKVYLSAVPTDEEASNFSRHSVFVPIMYQTAFLSLHDQPLFYTIGKNQFLEVPQFSFSQNQILKLKKGNFEVIPDIRQTAAKNRIYIADQIQEQGIYKLLKGDTTLAHYAFNDNRAESDMSYASEQEIKEKFPDTKIEFFSPGKESVQNTIKAANNGMQLWKLCLILALIFLAAEILIIKFYKAGKILDL